jgi:hypothetical protein
MSENTDKYSGVSNFDGKEADFAEFEIKLMALLETKDLEEYPLTDMQVWAKDKAKALKTDAKNPSNEEWEKYQQDKQALGYIKRYLKGSPLLLIKDCRTAYEAWTGILVKKYSVGDEDIDFDDLKLKMDECKLNNDKDPEVWFKELETVNIKLKGISTAYEEDDREIMARVCKQMCSEYDEVVKSFKRGKEMMGKSSTTNKDLFVILQKMIIDHWKTEVSGKRGGKMSGLNFNVGKDGKTIPICSHCGKKGHGEPKCWEKHGKPDKNKDSKMRFGKSTGAIKCYKCGGPHMKRNCPKLGNSDKDERKASEGINGLFINVMMCEVIEPKEEENKVLEEEELSINVITKKNYADALKGGITNVVEFLGDTGAQMHCMMSDPGTLWNEKKLNTSAKFGNDSKTKIEKKGDLNVVTEEGMGMVLKDIHIIPGCGRNILSLTQLQKEGWDYYTQTGKLFLKNNKRVVQLKEKEKNLHYLKL